MGIFECSTWQFFLNRGHTISWAVKPSTFRFKFIRFLNLLKNQRHDTRFHDLQLDIFLKIKSRTWHTNSWTLKFPIFVYKKVWKTETVISLNHEVVYNSYHHFSDCGSFWWRSHVTTIEWSSFINIRFTSINI